MKKEIKNLLNSEQGTFRINNVSYLNRWTKSALNEDVDKLELVFDNINNVCFVTHSYSIKSRDYDGIIEEISNATTDFFADVAESLVKDAKAGYRNAK